MRALNLEEHRECFRRYIPSSSALFGYLFAEEGMAVDSLCALQFAAACYRRVRGRRVQ